jgi:ABC-2 type transport system ATP-binding protein
MTEPDHSIETFALTRRFGDVTAVDAIDLRVPAGCFYGFLGPNGAGKSTTLKMLTGLLRPTSGTARILGLDVGRDLLEIKRHIGVVPETLALFDRLSGREYLQFVGRMHGLGRAVIADRSEELFALLDLAREADGMIVDYSYGMKKRSRWRRR